MKRAAAPTMTPERRGRDRDVEGLFAQLDDPDRAARRWAARDLAAHPESRAALVARLGIETDPPVREAILTTLLALGGPEVARDLAELLRSEDPSLRSSVIEILQHMPEEAAALVDDLLRDEDSDVRIFAVDVVRKLPHPRVPEWLRRVLRDEVHVNVVAAAVEAVSELATVDLGGDVLALKQRFPGNSYLAFLADAVAGQPGRAR